MLAPADSNKGREVVCDRARPKSAIPSDASAGARRQAAGEAAHQRRVRCWLRQTPALQGTWGSHVGFGWRRGEAWVCGRAHAGQQSAPAQTLAPTRPPYPSVRRATGQGLPRQSRGCWQGRQTVSWQWCQRLLCQTCRRQARQLQCCPCSRPAGQEPLECTAAAGVSLKLACCGKPQSVVSLHELAGPPIHLAPTPPPSPPNSAQPTW